MNFSAETETDNMNKELQEWTDDLIYKHALTFSHEELAGMYTIISKREQEYLKEIKSLRLTLQSHGEIVEMNAELREKVIILERIVSAYGNIAITGKIKGSEE